MTCTTYHALSSDVCDHLDMSSDPVHAGTCTTTRNDGHGRAVDQVLRNRDGPYATVQYYRLFTDYRADNAVTAITRAETTTDGLRGVAPVVSGHQTARTFTYDTVARRIGSTDPDSDSQSGSCTAATCTWRYLYSEVGDLVAVRDPRGCGQNFYYDKAGRLIGEDYVECAEALPSGDLPVDEVPASAVALVANIGAPRDVDVRYYYEDDTAPAWTLGYPEVASNITNRRYEGRLLAVSDRGQRSAMAYDARGQVSWAMRQMAVLENGPRVTVTDADPGPGLPPVTTETPVIGVARAYDEAHTYQRTAAYDHGGRPTSMVLPTDPDWTGTGAAPVIGGLVSYDARGLPNAVTLTMDAASRPIVSDIRYTEHGLVREVVYGDTTGPDGSARDATTSTTRYDACLRPREFETNRDATSGTGRDLGLVTTPMHQQLVWDEANNLVRVEDLRIAEEWPDSFRPQSVDIWHDALYRVVDAEYTYHQDAHTTGADIARDWRTDFATSSAADPMRPTPAAMAAALPAERVNTLRWRYDWLGNMQEWTDDASSFYERSLGDIENGADRATHERPGALHLASNIQKSASTIDVGADRGGWVEADYGENGNVVAMTVHAQCFDTPSTSCWDDATLEGPARATHLRAACACAEEQHYQYRWDELNRLHQARRFDRVSGRWSHAVTQRYRYDSANQRTIKSAEAIRPRGPPGGPGGPPAMEPERIALYIYPGDYERRGLERHPSGTYDASTVLETETQYLVGGARVVWKHNSAGTALDRDQRVTVALTDILQTSSAVMDLESGELLEASTYYPNGARESYRPQTITAVAAEPMGFTGKEADDEVGVVYFGERYLIPRLGRWASPDPLQVHAAGGGEAMNSYHYVGGNLLQARDPLGLDGFTISWSDVANAARETVARTYRAVADEVSRRAEIARDNLQQARERGVEGNLRDAAGGANDGLATWPVPGVGDVAREYEVIGTDRTTAVYRTFRTFVALAAPVPAGGQAATLPRAGAVVTNGRAVAVTRTPTGVEIARATTIVAASSNGEGGDPDSSSASDSTEPPSASGGGGPADFVVGSEGTAVPTSQARMRAGFDRAGIPSRPSTGSSEAGRIHTVDTPHGPVDVRTMEGGTHHPRRVVTTRPGTNDPVRITGERFRRNESRPTRRAESHLEQSP